MAPRGNSLRKHLFLVVFCKRKRSFQPKKRRKKKQKTFIHKSNLRTPISSHFLHQQTTNYELQSLIHQAYHLQSHILLFFFFFLHLSVQIFGIIAAVVVVVAAVQSENHSSFIQASPVSYSLLLSLSLLTSLPLFSIIIILFTIVCLRVWCTLLFRSEAAQEAEGKIRRWIVELFRN
jgi:hypothetical protein